MPGSVFDKPFLQNGIAAYAKLERIIWPNGLVCVHCGNTARIGLMKGSATRPGLSKRYACRRQFRATVGTVFQANHIPMHLWMQASYLMVSSKKGVSTHQMHRPMGVTPKSGWWFMTMRIRKAMKTNDTNKLGGNSTTVEADETYLRPKATNRAFRYKGCESHRIVLFSAPIQADYSVRREIVSRDQRGL